MKEEEIQAVLNKHNIPYLAHRTLWATIVPSVGAYNNGIGEVMHLMKDHILHFCENGIAILAVDDMNGTLKEDSFIFIPSSKIQSTTINLKGFKFVLVIQSEQGEIKYKIRRSILACPWHKENLSFLLFNTAQNTQRG